MIFCEGVPVLERLSDRRGESLHFGNGLRSRHRQHSTHCSYQALAARRRGRTRPWRRVGSWCRCRVGPNGSLDLNGNWGTRLEKPDVPDADRWWRAGIKAEVIQRSPADRVGILILRKGFAIPSRRIRGLIEAPGCAAKPGIVLGSVMRPARMLRRSVETDIRQTWLETWKHNFKGLNGAIQIHVKECVLIVP